MRWPRKSHWLEGVSNHPAARTLRAAREVEAGELQQPGLPIECAAGGGPGVIGRGGDLPPAIVPVRFAAALSLAAASERSPSLTML